MQKYLPSIFPSQLKRYVKATFFVFSIFATLIVAQTGLAQAPKAANAETHALNNTRAGESVPDKRAAVPACDLLDLQSSVKSVIQSVTPSVVAVDHAGSGIVISAEGLVLTASHVTRRINRLVAVQFPDGKMVQGFTVDVDFDSDIGVIQLLDPGPYPFTPLSPNAVGPKTWCISMGYPLSFPRGKPAVARLGRVLQINPNDKLVTDCTIMGGDSGGPLLDLQGQVIGINSSVKLDIEENLHAPTHQLAESWRQKLLAPTPSNRDQSNRQPERRYFGVNVETENRRVRIRHVHPKSPAEAAGLKRHDWLLAINDQAIVSFAQLSETLRSFSSSQIIRVTIDRRGERLELRADLSAGRAQP